ncbi:MAG: acetate--CoA ligase family protein, partial [Hyphomicrobiaceae bacterium]
THTGSLAGGDDVMDALFRRVGVARVHSLPILLETLKLLHVHGPLPGNTLVTMSCSGGEALLISDAAEGLEVDFPKLSEADEARIRPTVQPLVNLSNPFDYHTFDWGNRERLAATFGAVMECGFDLNLLVADLPREDRVEPSDWQIGVEAFAGAAEKIGARAGVLATLHECMPEERALELMARGVVPLLGIDEALQAVEAVAFLGRGTPDPFEPLGQVSVAPTNTHTLTEWEAKQHLASYGVPIPEGRLCRTSDDVAAVVAELGFPIVAKAVGRDVVHKTEMGAVRLNLDGLDHVAAAFGELRSLGDAVLLERMAPRPVAELIIGVSVDPVAGPYMLVGSGGVLAELVRDTRVIVLPTSPDEVRTAIGALGASRLLEGYRGQAKGDIEAVIDTAMAIARWVGDHHQGLVSLDVNPLMVAREGEGALAVDALIELREH